MAKTTEVTQEVPQEITANAEKPGKTEEKKDQNSETPVDFAAKVAELETQFTQLQNASKERIEALKKERKTLEGKLVTMENQYRGLQREVTPKMQEAAELRKQAVANQQVLTRLEELNATIELIGRRVLDDSEVEQLNQTRKQARLEAENKALKEQMATPAPAQANNPTPIVRSNLTEQRKQFLDYYFEGSKIDPNDPAIDWAEDMAQSNPNEAFRRITSSVTKVLVKKDKKADKEEEPVVEQPQIDFQAELAKIKEEATRLAQEEAKKLAREETEKRFRAAGMDAGLAPVNEGTRTFRAEINEELDEGLLTKGAPGSRERRESVDEYNRRLENVRTRRGF